MQGEYACIHSPTNLCLSVVLKYIDVIKKVIKGYYTFSIIVSQVDSDIIENERQTPVKSATLVFCEEFNGVKNYEIRRIDRFMYRTQYFSDSGIIGTKEFVFENYQRFKDVFMSKREKIPKPIAGLDGIYSLKRLQDKRR